MSKALYVYPLIFLAILCSSPQALPQEYKRFETNRATIFYSENGELSDFLWKIGRLRLDQPVPTSLAKSRVDRIVEQVEAVLDMYPVNFHVDIYLRSGYEEGNIAVYSNRTKSITVFVDRVTDGVLAHEIAHAVINAYFSTPPPSKIQEILCQYVDVHLWQNYR